MRFFVTIILLFIFLPLLPAVASNVYLGLGSSTAFSGRSGMALDFSLDLPEEFFLSSMTVGGANPAYYYSVYNLALIRFHKWGKGWFGAVRGGAGLGVSYTEKGLLNPDAQSDDLLNTTFGIGPAFRVGVDTGSVFMSVSYTMGLGKSAFAGGFGDVGLTAVGVML